MNKNGSREQAKPIIAKPIIVIGFRSGAEWLTLYKLSQWLAEHRPTSSPFLSLLLPLQSPNHPSLDLYDISTLPEKGDGLDAIGPETKLVIALHLFGIDKLPGGTTRLVSESSPLTHYNRNNVELLKLCMDRHIPLIAVGDQPWLGMQRRTQMYGALSHEPEVFLYETKETKETKEG